MAGTTTIRLLDEQEIEAESGNVKVEEYGVRIHEEDGVRVLPWHRIAEVVLPKPSGPHVAFG